MSGLILIQSFDIAFSDIAKLDELLEHAQFHAEKYGDNMLVFLSKHYGEKKDQHNKEHQEEERDHEKLPFQQQCNSASVVAIVLNASLSVLIPPQIPEGWAANFYYQAPSSSLHAQGLFQPPQTS
ncbi:hypothetical protein K8352_04545 [Flavobacteriaceae bacterium F89]|uniref:Uncharacterized protein n=1 Tax=Cerina litoralis TaxID=2874477 RepID=A0AAE3JQ95_9FLAO|nr:hypothetical protein [Cerina litoralis]MCG2460003.1 hypothetical protein [Cerina litoralis]